MALGSAGALFLCPDAGEGGVIVKAYGKSWGYNVYDCRYCLYRKGKLKGCVYPDGCCCPVPQKPARRNGIEQVYDAAADSAAPVSECEGCPYACWLRDRKPGIKKRSRQNRLLRLAEG